MGSLFVAAVSSAVGEESHVPRLCCFLPIWCLVRFRIFSGDSMMEDEGVRGVQTEARAHFQHPGQFLHLPHCGCLRTSFLGCGLPDLILTPHTWQAALAVAP